MNFIKILFKFLCFFLIAILIWPVNSSAETNETQLERVPERSELVIPAYLFTEMTGNYLFDLNGTLIFSSGKKIVIYNGISWDYIELNQESVIASDPDGQVFVGVGTTVYTLEFNATQSYFLSKYAEIRKSDTDLITQIICIEDALLINTSSSLYSFESQKVQELIENGENIKVFKTKTRTIIRNDNKYAGFSLGSGLGRWSESAKSFRFIEDHPQGFIAYSEADDQLYILAPSFSIQKMCGKKYSSKVFDIFHLANDNYGIITEGQNYIQIDPEGEKLSSEKLAGLNYKSIIKHSSLDRIWVSNSYGFSILDFSLPFKKLNTDHLRSSIISSCYYKGELYISDGYGLYKLPGTALLNSENIHSLSAINDGVVFIQDKHLYCFSDGDSRKVWRDKILNYKIDPIENNVLLEFKDHFLIVKPTFSGFFEKDKRIEKDFDQEFEYYSNSLYYFKDKSIFRLNIENLKKDSLIFSPNEKDQKIIRLLYTYNQFIIGTQNKVYRLTSDSLQIILSNDGKETQGSIIYTNNDFLLSYWIESNASPAYLKIILPNGKQESIQFFPKELSIHSNLSIQRLGKEDYYLINPFGIYHYKDVESFRKKFFVVPKSIIINGEKVFEGQIFELERHFLKNVFNKIPFHNNSIEIEYSSSDYLSDNSKFQYILMGRDDDWSSWESSNKLKISGLKPGDYLLKVRLTNVNNYVSETFKLSLTVLPPFYMSIYAKIVYFFLMFVALFILYRRYIVHSHSKSKKEKEEVKIEAFHKAEPLNVEPEEEINAAKIKEKKKSKWDKYSMVTVLFSDIQGFTKIAEMMNPEMLIDELDRFFFHFDSVVDKYNIEKIKTIGDAYMAAGGIPVRNITNPVEVVLAALEMQQYMKQLKNTKVDIWDLRIGIHTGPVIAGEIGHKKRSYDIWGDSVNIASRMESTGEPGKVNVSEVTYNLIKDFFICEYRGKIPVKYKGNLDMYFVTGLRPELTINLVGLPNKMFFLKLQLKRLYDLEEYIFEKLEQELSSSLYFHTSSYARQVYDHSFLLTKSENLDLEESLEVRTACLLLHLGYINNYKSPEVEAGRYIQEILSKFQYSERQINIIRNLILSTKQPYDPQNILEEIMIDSKMEYLGRADYLKIYKLLLAEEIENLGIKDPEQLKLKQIELLTNFEYFTSGARRLREISFEEQIEKLKEDNS